MPYNRPHLPDDTHTVPELRRLVLGLHLPQRRPHLVNPLQELVREFLLLALLQAGDLDLDFSDSLVSALACATKRNV
jgi:hypothetical protein